MANDARDTIAGYVARGNLKDAQQGSPSKVLPDDRKSELQAKLAKLRSAPGDIPDPSADPSDFGKAVRDREAAAEAEAKDPNTSKGKDVPRWKPDSRFMKPVYRLHDAVVNIPSPGGLGTIFFVILVFFLILIPATSAGDTRMLLLWEVLLGKKQIDQSAVPVVFGDGSIGTPSNGWSAGGGGFSFSTTPGTTPTPTPTGLTGPPAFKGSQSTQGIYPAVAWHPNTFDADALAPGISNMGGF